MGRFERTGWLVGVLHIDLGLCSFTMPYIFTTCKTKYIFIFGREILNSHLLLPLFPSVSAVAQQILWNCLIEDPALVLRHFLEKLTVSNRQVGMNFCNVLHLKGFKCQT